MSNTNKPLKILLIALYSSNYPAIGESHGLSVIAGSIETKLSKYIQSFEVIDMIGLSEDQNEIIKEKILELTPNVIGFSVSYGTFDILIETYQRIKQYISKNAILLFGGALATFIPEIILKSLSTSFISVVIMGEGDVVVSHLILKWMKNESFEGIPNLCYRKEGNTIITNKKLVSINELTLPYRQHVKRIYDNGAQVFVESSRGCSWAICTFCLRGLTDVKGKCGEYRRFPIERLEKDLINLDSLGVSSITFADEDFFGGHLSEIENFVFEFERVCIKNGFNFSFDASMTIHSIFSEKYTKEELEARINCLEKLRNIGLRKVFLGIESGSPSQIKRYAKGHSIIESVQAIRIIEDLKITLEVGFIMFDPVCTLKEIEENIDFINNNNIVQYISFFSSELRLQVESKYLKLVSVFEKRLGIKIYNRNLDLNTLSYEYKYVNADVFRLLTIVKVWNSRIRPIHYPLKNLSRYGDGGILGMHRKAILEIVTFLRKEYLNQIKETIILLKTNQLPLNHEKSIDGIMKITAKKTLNTFSRTNNNILRNSIVKSLLKSCKEELNVSIKS